MIVKILRQSRSGRGSLAFRFTRSMFLIAGLLALGYCGYAYAARSVYQAYGNWAFNRAIAHTDRPDQPTSNRCCRR